MFGPFASSGQALRLLPCPSAGRTAGLGKRSLRYGLKRRAWAALVLCAAAAPIASPAQTFTTLVNFTGTNGANPQYMSLVQGTDGSLYGTTTQGGANGYGTVFKLTPTGSLITLYNFCAETECADGAHPEAALVLGTDGGLYGTTLGNMASYYGTVFKITPAGTLTTLHTFDSTDGWDPFGALTQAPDGTFYGTTQFGGTKGGWCQDGCGTIFKMTPRGAFTRLYSFDSTASLSARGALVQGADGNSYGTTQGGGASNDGTVFVITPGGLLTTLHTFGFTDGAYPESGLFEATNGTFYGTTGEGGANGDGTIFSLAVGLGPFVDLGTLCFPLIAASSQPKREAGQEKRRLGIGCGVTDATPFSIHPFRRAGAAALLYPRFSDLDIRALDLYKDRN